MKYFIFSLMIAFSISACNPPQEKNATDPTSETSTEKVQAIEVIQFHSEHRCMTCNKIEALTQATLAQSQDIPFRLINVDDESNAEISEKFEAYGTALYLHDPVTGKTTDLTDFAFMNASDEVNFTAKLKEHIATFKN